MIEHLRVVNTSRGLDSPESGDSFAAHNLTGMERDPPVERRDLNVFI